MHRAWLRPLLTALLVLAAAGFTALSAWQWQRLAWKEALIARIERQLAGTPQPLPAHAAWPGLVRADDEYRRVQLHGVLEPQHEIGVLASTELGRGQWLMVPLRLSDGTRVWLNRGFVDEAHAEPASRPSPVGDIAVTGLLRWSEAAGWLWLRNRPENGRWMTREVAALSRTAGIDAAPFFIDVSEQGAPAGEASGPPAFPRAGLTVLRFSNNHRVYALTWAALALGSVLAAALVWRSRPAQPTA